MYGCGILMEKLAVVLVVVVVVLVVSRICRGSFSESPSFGWQKEPETARIKEAFSGTFDGFGYVELVEF